VDAAVARAVGAGVLVVAAAGNDGSTAPTYPSADPGVVSVAADDPGGVLYPWSNSGDWVSVAAPGCNQTTELGSAFGEFCGTSSAAAAVSGILGAVLGVAPKPARALAAAVAATATPASRRINAGALIGLTPGR
jgi:subtilisin family serine protease